MTIGLVLLLMYSPLGSQGKLLLTKLLAPTPRFLSVEDQYEIPSYQWRLKDKEWDFFSLEQSKGKVIFVSFWASWHLPSKASLESIETLYKRFGSYIVFLIISANGNIVLETARISDWDKPDFTAGLSSLLKQ